MNLPDIHFGTFNWCTYCGDPVKMGIDHLIPISFSYGKSRSSKRFDVMKPGYGPTTGCCGECNTVLSNLIFDTFYDRCRHINLRLKRKALPLFWTPAEIDKELFGSLNHYVHREHNRRRWYQTRSEWLDSKEFFETVASISTEPFFQPNHKLFHQEGYNYFATIIVAINEFKRKHK